MFPGPNAAAHTPEVAVVTGAAGGIGRAVVRSLLAAGHSVAALDLDREAIERSLTDHDTPERTLALSVDVTSGHQVADAFVEAARVLGPVSLVVSAAGVLQPAPLDDVTDASWERHLAVNATGTFHVLQAAARAMRPQGRGSIVVVSSNAAQVPRRDMAAYAASKAAASALARCVGLELAPLGIRCNVVEPGSTDTAMQRDLWPDADEGERRAIDGDLATFRAGIPLGRIAAPDDVADTVAFLLSDRARHLTMQRILVDGGASL